MGRIAPYLTGVLVLALVSAAPATAQCRLCDVPTTMRDSNDKGADVNLEIESSLSFDRLLLFGAGAGSALIRPDGSHGAEGAVVDVGPRAMVGSALVRGEPGRAVRVDLPRRIELHSTSGGSISFDQIESDLPAQPRLDSAGRLAFHFGGRLRISGDAEGNYRGDLPITVEYQ